MMIKGIDLSGYMVKNAPRAIAFYRDVLGLEPAKIYPDERGAEYELPDGTAFGLWGDVVDDLPAAVASLRARGIAIQQEIQRPVCSMAMIVDTEGNTVTLHQRKVS